MIPASGTKVIISRWFCNQCGRTVTVRKYDYCTLLMSAIRWWWLAHNGEKCHTVTMMTTVRWLTPRRDDDCHTMRMTVAWWWPPHGNYGYTMMTTGCCLILRVSWWASWLLFHQCPRYIVVLGSQVCQIHVKAFHRISNTSNYSMYRLLGDYSSIKKPSI